MKLFLEHASRSYWIQVLDDVTHFQPPFEGTPYPCLIWETRSKSSEEDRRALATAIIASGCRYAVCGGANCSDWHDAVDMAFLAQNLSEAESEERFVMTSWHTGEPPDDVAFFFVGNTNFDDHDFTKYLVVQLGSDWSTELALTEAVRVHATSPNEDNDQDDQAWGGGRDDHDWSGDAA